MMNQVNTQAKNNPDTLALTVNGDSPITDAIAELLTYIADNGLLVAFADLAEQVGDALVSLVTGGDADATPMGQILDALEQFVIAVLKAADDLVQAVLQCAAKIVTHLDDALGAGLASDYLNILYRWIQSSAGVPDNQQEDLTLGRLWMLIPAFFATTGYKLAMGVDNPPFPGGTAPTIPPPSAADGNGARQLRDDPDANRRLVLTQAGFGLGLFLPESILYGLTDVAPEVTDNPVWTLINVSNAFTGLASSWVLGCPGLYGLPWDSPFTWSWVTNNVLSLLDVGTSVFGSGIPGVPNSVAFKNLGDLKIGSLVTAIGGALSLGLEIWGCVLYRENAASWSVSVLSNLPGSFMQIPRFVAAFQTPEKRETILAVGAVLDGLMRAIADLIIASGAFYELNHPPYIRQQALTSSKVGIVYPGGITAEGGTGVMQGGLQEWSATGLPKGLTLDPDTGEFLGAPQETGTFTVKPQVWDGYGPPLASPPVSLTLVVDTSPVKSVAATTDVNQSAPAGSVFQPGLVVGVTDQDGKPVPSALVTFTAPSTGASGTFSGASEVTCETDEEGRADAGAFTANGTQGTYQVTASVKGVAAATATFNLTNTAPAAAKLSPVAGTPQSAPINTAFATPLAVKVLGLSGDGIGNVTVTFSVPDGGAGGAFVASPQVVTGPDGVATAPTLIANGVAGGFAVTATVVGVQAAVTFDLTNTPVLAALAPTPGSTPQYAAVSTVFANLLEVTVLDSSGNPVPNVMVNFTAPPSGASGIFDSSNARTLNRLSSPNGKATAGAFIANGVTGFYTVTASVANTGVSASFALGNTDAPSPEWNHDA
jgi:hypothetical protein